MDMEFLESFRTPQPNRPSRVELRGAIGLYLYQPRNETFMDKYPYRSRRQEAKQIIRREQEAEGLPGIPETMSAFVIRRHLEVRDPEDT